MESDKTKQLLCETLNKLAQSHANLLEVVQLAELLIINTWKICDKTQDGIDAICGYIDETLKPTLEEELETMVIDKVLNK